MLRDDGNPVSVTPLGKPVSERETLGSPTVDEPGTRPTLTVIVVDVPWERVSAGGDKATV